MEVVNRNSFIDELINSNKYDKNFNSTCMKVGDDVCSSKLTVVDLVEQLGTLLVNTSPEKREHGLLILSKVFAYLPKDFLNSSQLNFITAFYADRLKDHHQVVPVALQGILVLLNFKNLADGCLSQILHSLFQNVSCQQQQRQDRFIIYKIFESALDNQLEELKSMGMDFVYGVISTIDGERDPRNLLFLFSWLPKFIKSVTLGHLTEEMFEVIACYFPVDFKAPSNDINGISRDALAKALCPCLCCTEDFAQFCLPLALEKLSSSLKVAKLDSLDLLIEGCKTFSVSSYSQNSIEMWSLLQKEILHNIDEEVVNKSLHTLTHIINKLSQNMADSTFKQTVSDIIDTVKGNLRPDTRLFSASSRILLHITKASETSAVLVIKDILPQLLNLYNITTTVSNQVLIFESIIDYVKAYIEVSGKENIMEIKELAFVPNLCLKVAVSAESSLRTVGLRRIGEIVKSIPADLRSCIYENMVITLPLGLDQNEREALLSCFKEITRLYPAEVEEKVLNKIVTKDVTSLDLYLNALCEIASIPNVTRKVLLHFLNNCNGYKELDRLRVIMKNIKKLLITNKRNAEIHSFLLHNSDIINFIVNLLCKDLQNVDILQHEEFLNDIVEVLEFIVGFQELDVQRSIIEKYLHPLISLFRETKNLQLVVALHGLLCQVRQDVISDYGLIEDLCTIALNSANTFIFHLTSQLLANIINKLKAENVLSSNLEIIERTVQNAIQINNRNSIALLAWANKALVMRGHVHQEHWTKKLIQLLEEYEEAALTFEVIMNNNYRCLSLESHCNIRLLYRQKFFTDVIDKLVKEDKQHYLLAVGYLLKETPKQVVVMYFKKLLKAIVLCLEKMKNPEVLCSILDILFLLLSDKEALFEDYVQEFVPRFLNLSKFEKSMKVRMKALQCLQAYTVGYTIHKLLPHKQLVIHELTQCLDDPKRMVRKEAVLARNCWFLLDSPT